MADLHTLRASVTLYYQTFQSKKRGSAIFTGVKSFQGFLEGRFHHQGSYFTSEACHHAFFDHGYHGSSHAFIKLEDHISHKRFADNYICVSCRDVPCLNASDEIDIFACF